MTFKDLNLQDAFLEEISNQKFSQPTIIQQNAIPFILEGKDVLGCAQTGSGKTAAYVLPILQNILINYKKETGIQALIVVPTRELALQVSETVNTYSKKIKIQHLTLIGGESINKQINLINNKLSVLIATPGRLLDLIQQKFIDLQNIKTLVLDEADQMLDMGFIKDIKRIIGFLPKKRQTLLFSATMPNEIKEFALKIQYKPVEISVEDTKTTKPIINQEVFLVDKEVKKEVLLKLLKDNQDLSTIVFVRTKYNADKMVKILKRNNIAAVALHGDKSQNARVNALANFKNKTVKVLIATDIAARGIDIYELPLVINFDIPAVAETYVHRIGRTGRAGKTGKAISLCGNEELKSLKNIEKLIGKTFNKKQYQ